MRGAGMDGYDLSSSCGRLLSETDMVAFGREHQTIGHAQVLGRLGKVGRGLVRYNSDRRLVRWQLVLAAWCLEHAMLACGERHLDNPTHVGRLEPDQLRQHSNKRVFDSERHLRP